MDGRNPAPVDGLCQISWGFIQPTLDQQPATSGVLGVLVTSRAIGWSHLASVECLMSTSGSGGYSSGAAPVEVDEFSLEAFLGFVCLGQIGSWRSFKFRALVVDQILRHLAAGIAFLKLPCVTFGFETAKEKAGQIA